MRRNAYFIIEEIEALVENKVLETGKITYKDIKEARIRQTWTCETEADIWFADAWDQFQYEASLVPAAEIEYHRLVTLLVWRVEPDDSRLLLLVLQPRTGLTVFTP